MPLYSRFLSQLYLFLAALLCIASLAGFARFWPALGQPFGGFIWQYDDVYGFTVSYDVPRHWPGPHAGLVPYTTILAINGRPPQEFGAVYRTTPVGELVTYEVRTREGERRTIAAPVVRFGLSELFDAYGVIFLAGLVSAGAGYVLLRSTPDTGRTLLAFVLLTGAISALYHTYHGDISSFHLSRFWLAFMWAPSPALLGALLCHVALVYPRRRAVLERHFWVVPLCYALALALGVSLALAFFFGADPHLAALQHPLMNAGIGLMALGAATTLASGFWTLLNPRTSLAPAERRQVKILAVAWTLDMLVVIGTIAAVNLRLPTLFDFLIFLAFCLPIGLVYAITNADLIGQLEEQSATRGALLEEVREVHRLQERILSDLADELHDSALAESKGLEICLYTLLRRAEIGHIEGTALRRELATLHEQSQALGRTLRQTVEGAKPIDFNLEGLVEVLERMVAQLNATRSPTTYALEIAGDVDDCTIEVKRELYWIIRAALNNVREHAHAQHCTIRLARQNAGIALTISDDGRGIDAHRTSAIPSEPRRRLGLSSIRSRTARIGGKIELAPSKRGTRVHITIPLAPITLEDPIYRQEETIYAGAYRRG